LDTKKQHKKNTVILFGEVLADIFPDRTVLGGAPFNVARHLQAFGLHPVLITRLGDDALRDEVLDVMTETGMETLGIQCGKSHPTGRVQVSLEKGLHHFDILPDQAYDFIHPAVVRMISLSANPSLIYYGTLAQRNPISERALKSLIRSTDATKFLDINLREPWYNKKTIQQSMQYANIMKLNQEELQALAKMFKLTAADAPGQAKELQVKFDLEQILVTCGAAGAWHMNKSGRKIEVGIKNPVSNIKDTVGAGDGFAAVCILGSLRRWPIAKTLERANNFAAAICEIRGAVPDHADFYVPFTTAWEI
jgi:fructokinase